MKKSLLILALLCAPLTWAQDPYPPSTSRGGNITSTNAACVPSACVGIGLSSSFSAVITVGITGTYSATLAVEESQDGGTTWTSAGTSLTSTGTTSYVIAGFTNFRVRASAYVSGNAGVNLQVSNAPSGGVTSGTADPTGNACAPNSLFVVTTTGALYTCKAGVFAILSGGGAGTVTTTGSPTTNILPKFTGATSIGNSSCTDNATTFACTEPISTSGATSTTQAEISSTGAATVSGSPLPYWFINPGGGTQTWSSTGTLLGFDAPTGFSGNVLDYRVASSGSLLFRVDANGSMFNLGGSNNGSTGLSTWNAYATGTNCSNSANPAVCSTAAAGSVVIASAATAVQVNTTRVTANSQVIVVEDSSLGTKLGVTCNTTIARTYAVTARVASTSFTITTSAAPVTNPACLSYWVIN